MKFDIKLNAKDLWGFSLYHSNRGFLGIFNVLFTCASLFLLVYTWNTSTNTYKVMLAVCALMFSVWQPFLLWMKSKKQALRPAVKEPMQMEFLSEGLKVSQLGQETVTLWGDIFKVEKLPFMMIIYVDRIHAYLIPKRVMEGREEELTSILKNNLPKEVLKHFR